MLLKQPFGDPVSGKNFPTQGGIYIPIIFPISAFADDPDGAANVVTFLSMGSCDDESTFSILRTPGIVEENVIYSTNINISELIDLDTMTTMSLVS